ncbi:hypothetical protein [Azospirillum sp. sgz301742]
MSFPGPDIAETVAAAFEADRLPTEVLRTCPPSLWLPMAVVAVLVLTGGAMAAGNGLGSLAPHVLAPHAVAAPSCQTGGTAP